MVQIGNLIELAINGAFDIRDSRNSSKPIDNLTKSTITLVCCVDDTLPLSTATEYCKSLEVAYCVMVRSLLTASVRTRSTDTAKSIFRSIPLLTPYDMVAFDKKLNGTKSIVESILNSGESSSATVTKFASESIRALADNYNNKDILQAGFSMEADAFLKESSVGGVGTFVDIELKVNSLGSTMDRRMSLGVRVIPKMISKEEVVGFFIKRSKVVTATPKGSLFSKIKAGFTFNKSRIQQHLKTPDAKKTFMDSMEDVKNIDKPFVAMLMSNTTASMIDAAGVKVTSPQVLHDLYTKLPIVSVSIMNTHLDTITYSLSRDTIVATKTMGEFKSEIAGMEKELSELIRVNNRY